MLAAVSGTQRVRLPDSAATAGFRGIPLWRAPLQGHDRLNSIRRYLDRFVERGTDRRYDEPTQGLCQALRFAIIPCADLVIPRKLGLTSDTVYFVDDGRTGRSQEAPR